MRGILDGRINGSPVLPCPDDVVVGRGVASTGMKVVDDERIWRRREYWVRKLSPGSGSDPALRRYGSSRLVVLLRGEARPT
jgi:hypothetical protein